MKFFTACLLISQAAAFTVAPQSRAATHLYADYEPMEGEGKMNLKVRLVSSLAFAS
jgi:hypothetical protein